MKSFLVLLSMFICTLAFADDLSTRYGMLSLKEWDSSTLYFKGKPVEPEISAISSFTFLNKFEIGNTDVVVLQNNGGSGCAAYYSFLTVSKSGLEQSTEFGTCSDIPKIKREKDKVIVEMPNLKDKGTFKYIYSAGVIYQNGKKLKAPSSSIKQ